MATPLIPSRSASLLKERTDPGKVPPAHPQSSPSPPRNRADVIHKKWDNGFSPEEYHREKGFVVVEEEEPNKDSKVASWFRSVFKKDDDKKDRKRDRRSSVEQGNGTGPGTGVRSNTHSGVRPSGPVNNQTTGPASSLSRVISEPFRSTFLGIPPSSPSRLSTSSSRSSEGDRNSDDTFKPSALGRTFSESTNDNSTPATPVIQPTATGMAALLSKMKTGLAKAPSSDFHSNLSLDEKPRVSTERPYLYASGLGSAELWPGLATDREPGVDQPVSRRTSMTYSSSSQPPLAQQQPPLSFAPQLKPDLSLRRRASPIPGLARSRSSKTEIKTVPVTPWGKPIDPVRMKEDMEFVGVMRSKQVWWEGKAVSSGELGAATPIVSPGNVAFVSAEALQPPIVDVKTALTVPAVVSDAPTPSPAIAPLFPLSRQPSGSDREDRVEKEKRFETMIRHSRLASLKDGVLDVEVDEAEIEPASAADSRIEAIPEHDPADTLLDPPRKSTDIRESSDKPPLASGTGTVSPTLLALLANAKSTPVALSITEATLPRTEGVVVEGDLEKAAVAVSPTDSPPLPPRRNLALEEQPVRTPSDLSLVTDSGLAPAKTIPARTSSPSGASLVVKPVPTRTPSDSSLAEVEVPRLDHVVVSGVLQKVALEPMPDRGKI